MSIIQVKKVSKTYKTRKNSVLAVNNVSLTIEPAKITALLGPNGSGKTTLIKMLCGLIIPDNGEVLIENINIQESNKPLSNIGCILEGERNVYYYLTVFDNLFYFGSLNKIPKKELISRIDNVLNLLQLSHKRSAYVSELSRGMQQKVALGIVLIKDPQILLLDEPTLGLDVAATKDLMNILIDMSKRGKTIIITTHQMEIAEKMSDYIILFQHGQVLDYKTKEHLLQEFNEDGCVLIEFANDIERLNKEELFKDIGKHMEENTWLFELHTFKDVIQVMNDNNLRIKDIKKIEKSLEDIFLELIG
jgi:ABC-2 type transport system ATP-binding protein